MWKQAIFFIVIFELKKQNKVQNYKDSSRTIQIFIPKLIQSNQTTHKNCYCKQNLSTSANQKCFKGNFECATKNNQGILSDHFVFQVCLRWSYYNTENRLFCIYSKLTQISFALPTPMRIEMSDYNICEKQFPHHRNERCQETNHDIFPIQIKLLIGKIHKPNKKHQDSNKIIHCHFGSIQPLVTMCLLYFFFRTLYIFSYF